MRILTVCLALLLIAATTEAQGRGGGGFHSGGGGFHGGGGGGLHAGAPMFRSSPGLRPGFRPGFNPGVRPGFDRGFRPGLDRGFRRGFGRFDNRSVVISPFFGFPFFSAGIDPFYSGPIFTAPTSITPTLILKDRRRIEAAGYALVGSTLRILNAQDATKISLSDVDVDATQRENQKRGINVVIPPNTSQRRLR